ncbi:hypothetical protein [Clostridium sartagoforme]|uniref:hypothetical protein n=1 Tax=Clostridium sartagoforme TaxID=84031 RepID=UPI0003A9CDC8|nr:hypothetical protein [Clostridium sartagoforme]
MVEKLLEKLRELEIGDRITLVMENFFGGTIETRATYKGNLKPYGYISENSGGWALYPCEAYNIQCYKFNIIPYRCIHPRMISLFDVKDVRKGW